MKENSKGTKKEKKEETEISGITTAEGALHLDNIDYVFRKFIEEKGKISRSEYEAYVNHDSRFGYFFTPPYEEYLKLYEEYEEYRKRNSDYYMANMR